MTGVFERFCLLVDWWIGGLTFFQWEDDDMLIYLIGLLVHESKQQVFCVFMFGILVAGAIEMGAFRRNGGLSVAMSSLRARTYRSRVPHSRALEFFCTAPAKQSHVSALGALGWGEGQPAAE